MNGDSEVENVWIYVFPEHRGMTPGFSRGVRHNISPFYAEHYSVYFQLLYASVQVTVCADLSLTPYYMKNSICQERLDRKSQKTWTRMQGWTEENWAGKRQKGQKYTTDSFYTFLSGFTLPMLQWFQNQNSVLRYHHKNACADMFEVGSAF